MIELTVWVSVTVAKRNGMVHRAGAGLLGTTTVGVEYIGMETEPAMHGEGGRPPPGYFWGFHLEVVR